jgi:hypothetical protein
MTSWLSALATVTFHNPYLGRLQSEHGSISEGKARRPSRGFGLLLLSSAAIVSAEHARNRNQEFTMCDEEIDFECR